MRSSKSNSKLSLEKALVRLFGLGGQYPDSSTKILLQHKNWMFYGILVLSMSRLEFSQLRALSNCNRRLFSMGRIVEAMKEAVDLGAGQTPPAAPWKYHLEDGHRTAKPEPAEPARKCS